MCRWTYIPVLLDGIIVGYIPPKIAPRSACVGISDTTC